MENVMANKTIWQKIKWWFNFITSIIMNSIIVILVLIGFLFLAYYIDVTKNVINAVTIISITDLYTLFFCSKSIVCLLKILY